MAGPQDPRSTPGDPPATASASDGPPNLAMAVTAPALSLPKGGGAIRGIGEKFAANPVTGTGSMSVPLPMSPGRSGFRPAAGALLRLRRRQRSVRLRLDPLAARDHPQDRQGAAAIRRRERIGRLSPLRRGGSGAGLRLKAEGEASGTTRTGRSPTRTTGTATIRRYRPRIEGLFARIERWTTGGRQHRRPLAIDHPRQRHHALRQRPQLRIADPAGRRPRLQLADLREP